MSLAQCIFVPSNISPFKTSEEPQVEPLHRIEMLKITIKNEPKFGLDTFETDRGGISYTIDTIGYFKNKFTTSELYYLIGDDQAVLFTQWKDWHEIIEMTQLCIARRNPGLTAVDISKINMELTSGDKTPVWLDCPIAEISSSEIRNRITVGKPYQDLLPPGVAGYIEKHSLYKDNK